MNKFDKIYILKDILKTMFLKNKLKALLNTIELLMDQNKFDDALSFYRRINNIFRNMKLEDQDEFADRVNSYNHDILAYYKIKEAMILFDQQADIELVKEKLEAIHGKLENISHQALHEYVQKNFLRLSEAYNALKHKDIFGKRLLEIYYFIELGMVETAIDKYYELIPIHNILSRYATYAQRTEMFKLLNRAYSDIQKRIELRKYEKPTDKFEDHNVQVLEQKQEVKEEVIKSSKNIFSKIKQKVTSKVLSQEEFENLFWDLELVLMENNVAVEVIEKIKEDLKKQLTQNTIERGKVQEIIQLNLKKSIEKLFKQTKYDLATTIKNSKHKPFVIVFFGINGAGKTTTISKLASKLKNNNISSIMVAADTWRSAEIEQLEAQGNKIGIKVIKHQYGSDPTAVAYDGVAFAKAHNIACVLIDTAGRQHNNLNLTQQMEKIVRVIKPNLKVFVGESTTGNDCIEQAKKFDEVVGIDAIILSKADIDERGGAAISISYVIDKPIIYLGMGQKVEDLKEFKKEEIINSLGL